MVCPSGRLGISKSSFERPPRKRSFERALLKELFQKCSFERPLSRDLRRAPRDLRGAPRRSFRIIHGGGLGKERRSFKRALSKDLRERALWEYLRGGPRRSAELFEVPLSTSPWGKPTWEVEWGKAQKTEEDKGLFGDSF
eukprot:gene13248-biopygen11646